MNDIIYPGKTLPARPERDTRISHGPRQRYRGKMVNPAGAPRSHGGGSGNSGRAPTFSMCPSPERAPDTGSGWPRDLKVGLASGLTRHCGVGYRGWND